MKKEANPQKLNNIFRKYKVQSIENIIDYEHNSRTHSDEQIDEVVKSINEFGYTNPILVDEKNILIAGHCRVAGAKRAGLTEIPTIIIDGLTDVQKAALVIADNKMALNAGWDFNQLAHQMSFLKENNFNTDLTGFTADEIQTFMPDDVPPFDGDEDEIPELPTDPITKLGDVWLMGKHRIMCGDSTLIDNIDLLMNGEKADMVFTDPPYNTGMTSESQKGSGGLWKGTKGKGTARLSHMFDDAYTDEEWKTFLAGFMGSYWMLMKDGSVAYICLDWRRNHELIPYIESSGFKRSNLIVWDKMVHGLGSDYKYTHEFINVCKKGDAKLDTHQGDDREYSDVWHIQRKMGKNEDHATAKPVELMERAIRHGSKPNQLVVDLFGGSGSTLVACEKTRRKCFMMELSPIYCDVIVTRWEKLTGKKAKLESDNGTRS